MEVLCAFVGGSGHCEPLVPIATALREAGHRVSFAGSPRVLPSLRPRGFPVHPIGRPGGGRAPEKAPLLEPDQAREELVVVEHFVQAGMQRLADWQALLEEVRPDLVVRDEMAHASALAAELLAIPVVDVSILAAANLARPSLIDPALGPLRVQVGLPAESPRRLLLSAFPASLREHPLPPDAFCFHTRVPPPIPHERTTVHVTLGSEFPLESGDLFPRLLAGLSRLPVDIITTVGRHYDLADLGEQPDNVRVERWLPLDETLAACDLVVHHGGSGTLLGAVAHGRPQLVTAMGADQMDNARRVEALGLGRSLPPVTVTPEEACAAAEEVLASSAVTNAVERLRQEIQDLPPVSDVVSLLEERGHVRQ